MCVNYKKMFRELIPESHSELSSKIGIPDTAIFKQQFFSTWVGTNKPELELELGLNRR